MSAPHADRFWSKVGQETDDGCWEWQGFRVRDYGRFTLNGRAMLAHRVAYELHEGPIPPGMLVCHHCDNPPCVRPYHLFLGTHADNCADKVAKGRGRTVGRPGELNAWTRLTSEQVVEIRSLYTAGGVRYRDLAPRYGVTPAAIGAVVRGDNWRHLGGGRRRTAPLSKLTEGDVRVIRERLAAGDLHREIAQAFGVSRGLVSSINTGRIWATGEPVRVPA